MFFLTPKSEVVYLYEDYSLRQALEKMEYHRFGAVPVLNRKGNYVGTLSEGDLLWNIKDKYAMNMQKAEEIPLSSIERRWHNEPVSIGCNIEDLILTSMNQNFVPVIDDKKIFIGIITRKDIIQYCYNCYKEVEEMTERSHEVRENPHSAAFHR